MTTATGVGRLRPGHADQSWLLATAVRLLEPADFATLKACMAGASPEDWAAAEAEQEQQDRVLLSEMVAEMDRRRPEWTGQPEETSHRIRSGIGRAYRDRSYEGTCGIIARHFGEAVEAVYRQLMRRPVENFEPLGDDAAP